MLRAGTVSLAEGVLSSVVVGSGTGEVLSVGGAWVGDVSVRGVWGGSSTIVREIVAVGSDTCWAGGLAQPDTPTDIAVDQSKMMVLALKCYTPSVVGFSLSFV